MRAALCLALVIWFAASALASQSILLVVSNHADLGDTGRPTGFFLSEAAHPWKVFRNAGYEVTLASPKGGFAPIDPKSFKLDDPINAEFWKEFGNGNDRHPAVPETPALAEANSSDYAAIFFAGGHGAMWDFPDDKALQDVTAKIYEDGGVVGAVCHGPAALVNVTLSDGSPLVKGRRVAPFTNAEEAAVELTDVVPFLLQDRLESVGAKPQPGENFQDNAVRDGRLVTGQNPASASHAAELVVEALKED